MKAYEQLVNCLRQSAARAGGKAELMRFLGAKKATFYRALDDENPVLPSPMSSDRSMDPLNDRLLAPPRQLPGAREHKESHAPARVTGLFPEQPERRKRQARCLIMRACRIQKTGISLRLFWKRRYPVTSFPPCQKRKRNPGDSPAVRQGLPCRSAFPRS